MTDPMLGTGLQEAMAAAGGTGMSPGGDRRTLALREQHETLIELVAGANPRTVVAVMGGSAVVIERWRRRVPAILLLWYPGMEGGHALADVLLGRVEPGGRLPFAVPTDAAHLPPFDRAATRATYDLWHGQWKLDRDGTPAAFPFGFGLSYTTFALRDARVAGAGPERVVHVTVANTGARSGSDVVQVYGGLPGSAYERPVRRLLGFRRIALDSGAAATVAIPISLATLAVRRDGGFETERGAYRIEVARFAGDPDALTCTAAVD